MFFKILVPKGSEDGAFPQNSQRIQAILMDQLNDLFSSHGVGLSFLVNPGFNDSKP